MDGFEVLIFMNEFKELPSLKKKLCLSLKNKKTSITKAFEELSKPFQSDGQSRFVLPVKMNQKEWCHQKNLTIVCH